MIPFDDAQRLELRNRFLWLTVCSRDEAVEWLLSLSQTDMKTWHAEMLVMMTLASTTGWLLRVETDVAPDALLLLQAEGVPEDLDETERTGMDRAHTLISLGFDGDNEAIATIVQALFSDEGSMEVAGATMMHLVDLYRATMVATAGGTIDIGGA